MGRDVAESKRETRWRAGEIHDPLLLVIGEPAKPLTFTTGNTNNSKGNDARAGAIGVGSSICEGSRDKQQRTKRSVVVVVTKVAV